MSAPFQHPPPGPPPGPAEGRSSGPTALRARSLAPDLARGLMLLFIALANSHSLLNPPWATGLMRGIPLGGDTLDATIAGLLVTFVDGRSYTMFAALFGYGIVQLAGRQARAGATHRETVALLRRRGGWLILLGFLHAMLLFPGDILEAYGLLAVFLVGGALRLTGRGLAVRVGLWMVAGSLLYGLLSWPMGEANAQLALGENPLAAALLRASGSFLIAPIFAITAAGAFLVGAWAARRRVLEEPERHLTLLRRTAVTGIGVSTLGGLPLGLIAAGFLPASPALAVPAGFLHALTGYAGGPGYAAAIALLAAWIGSRPGPVTKALQATGQRSLTCYLVQSVVWHVAFAPYLLGLATRWGLARTALLAIGTWALTVCLAEVLRRLDRRGPAEVLLRRLTYRRPSTVAASSGRE